MKNEQLKLILKVLLQLAKLWYSNLDQIQTRSDIVTYIRLLDKYISTKGMLWTIKRVKLLRLLFTRYFSGDPIYSTDTIVGINKDGFPKCVEFLQKYESQPFGISFIMTLLSVSRGLKYTATPSYKSITDPFSGMCETLPNEAFGKRFISDFKLDEQVDLRFTEKNIFFSTKAGPMFNNSLMSSIAQIPAYTGITLDYMRHITSNTMDLWINELKLNLSSFNSHISKYGLINRRLSIINDPEAKSRVIAIADYFTQVTLNPLSEHLFNLLKRRFPQDRTFTQNPKILNKRPGQKYWSIDLTSATDRFPIKIQEFLLEHMISWPLSQGWKSAMISEEYLTPEGGNIRYSVGQPMGLRTSWPMFTIAHHYLVQYASNNVKKYPFKEYILLGDDIVIYDDEVAQEYLRLLSYLGVENSPMKTHISENCYEFAKRWFKDGTEVSGIPINGILETLDKPVYLMGYMYNLFKHVHPSSMLTSKDMCLKLLKSHSSKRNFNRGKNLIENLYSILRTQDGSLIEIRSLFCEATKDNDYIIPTEENIMLEVSRVSSFVANGVLWDMVRKIGRFFVKMKKNIKELSLLNTEPTDLLSIPIIIAISNMLEKTSDSLKPISMQSYSLDKLVEVINLVDIDRLAKNDRKSYQIFGQKTVLASKMFSELRFDAELNVSKVRNTEVQRAIFDLRINLSRLRPKSQKAS